MSCVVVLKAEHKDNHSQLAREVNARGATFPDCTLDLPSWLGKRLREGQPPLAWEAIRIVHMQVIVFGVYTPVLHLMGCDCRRDRSVTPGSHPRALHVGGDAPGAGQHRSALFHVPIIHFLVAC